MFNPSVLHTPICNIREWCAQAIECSYSDSEKNMVYAAALFYLMWMNSLPTYEGVVNGE